MFRPTDPPGAALRQAIAYGATHGGHAQRLHYPTGDDVLVLDLPSRLDVDMVAELVDLSLPDRDVTGRWYLASGHGVTARTEVIR